MAVRGAGAAGLVRARVGECAGRWLRCHGLAAGRAAAAVGDAGRHPSAGTLATGGAAARPRRRAGRCNLHPDPPPGPVSPGAVLYGHAIVGRPVWHAARAWLAYFPARRPVARRDRPAAREPAAVPAGVRLCGLLDPPWPAPLRLVVAPARAAPFAAADDDVE